MLWSWATISITTPRIAERPSVPPSGTLWDLLVLICVFRHRCLMNFSSFDTEFTRFYSQCDLHANPTELGENLGRFMESKIWSAYFLMISCHVCVFRKSWRSISWFLDSLKKWHSKNGSLPNRVFVYRDGCSEGQIANVLRTEIDLVFLNFVWLLYSLLKFIFKL